MTQPNTRPGSDEHRKDVSVATPPAGKTERSSPTLSIKDALQQAGGALWGVVSAAVVFVAATIANAHFGPMNDTCNTVAGNYAQQESNGTLAHCGAYGLIVQIAAIAKWGAIAVGLLSAVGVILASSAAASLQAKKLTAGTAISATGIARRALRLPTSRHARYGLAGLAVAVAIATGVAVAVSGSTSSANTYALDIQLPQLASQLDIGQLAGATFTSDGCKFESPQTAGGGDTLERFDCPSDAQFVSGEVRLSKAGPSAALANIYPDSCTDLGADEAPQRFLCSFNVGSIGGNAYGVSLAVARTRALALADAVARLALAVEGSS